MSDIHDHDPSIKHCECELCAAAADSAAVSEADSKWFEKNSKRRHLVRPSTRGEIYLSMAAPQDGVEYCTLVKQIPPGVRFRHFIFAPEGYAPFWCDEPTARKFFSSFGLSLRKAKQKARKWRLH